MRDLMYNITNKYYDCVYYIKHFFTSLKKSLDWHFNVLRYDYDFDANSLYNIINYKLKRTEIALINGFCDHDRQKLKAIRLAIKLSNRLYKNFYDELQYKRQSALWGELLTWTTPHEDTEYVQMHFRYEKAITEEEKKQSTEDHMKLGYAMEALRNRDKRNLFFILDKYIDSWWD